MSHTPSQTFKQARNIVYNRFVRKGATNIQAKDMEKGVLDYLKDECKKRKFDEIRWSDIRVRRLYIRKANMVVNNMPKILEKVNRNDIESVSVAKLSHYDIDSTLWEPIMNRIKQREICSMIADNEDQYEGLLKCEQCGSMNTRYVTVQTRSADEPETVFASCKDCNANWTMN